MKNAIEYYYHLKATDIHQKKKQYRFKVDTTEYLLTPCYRNLEELNYLYDMTLELLQRNVYCHQIILNREHLIITTINGVPYILLKTIIVSQDVITMHDINMFSNYTMGVMGSSKLRRDNWYLLWCEKIDYFEYQVSEFGKKYPVIRDSFSYYVGLAETAILLLQSLDKTKEMFTVCHHRIYKNETLFDFYNPLSFVIDAPVRDICEYFKHSFLGNPYVIDEIEIYLGTHQLSHNQAILFLARMLFPSYYFDVYEDIIAGQIEEEALISIIQKNREYEHFLQSIYELIKKTTSFPDVEWLH